ncbi:MAG TPA: hypothetical protein DEQ02_09315, partial [Ruminococcaceae bacterium]|nr:hypothetical protein [Oscillospiraceae bacterium]
MTYLNGRAVKKDIISTVIIKNPIQQQAVIGAGRGLHDSEYTPLASGGNGVTTGAPVWPVDRVERSYISARWGAGRGHTGWDIAAPVGTEIYIFDGGTVVSINEDSGSYGEHF